MSPSTTKSDADLRRGALLAYGHRTTAVLDLRLPRDMRSLALRLALAVAAPAGRVFRIDPDNKYRGSTSIVAAAMQGWCFAVEVGRDILAIDVDDPSLRPPFEVLVREMEESGVRPVIVASGRPGNRHVFARIEDPTLLESLASRARELNLPPRRDIRPPLAPHRAGLSPGLISPTHPLAALEALAPGRTRPELSPRLAHLLRWGDQDKRYPSRSEADAAIALGAVNSGWTFDEFRAAMLDEGNQGGERAQEEGNERGEWAADHYLGLTWEAALIRYRRNPPASSRAFEAALEMIRAAVEGTPWRGRRGVTDFVVLMGVIGISEQAVSLEFTASHRQIAEAAGRDRKTVARALERLSGGRNWLMKLKAGAGDTATRWRLRIPENREDTPLGLTPPLESSNGSERRFSSGHDAFRHGALNASGFQIYDLLDPETPQTRSQLAEKTGRHPSTVSTALKSLKEHGLAEKRGIGWVRLETDLNEVAEDLGSAGAGDRQRERHVRERDGYREYREWRAYQTFRVSAGLVSVQRRWTPAPWSRRAADGRVQKTRMEGTGISCRVKPTPLCLDSHATISRNPLAYNDRYGKSSAFALLEGYFRCSQEAPLLGAAEEHGCDIVPLDCTWRGAYRLIPGAWVAQVNGTRLGAPRRTSYQPAEGKSASDTSR